MSTENFNVANLKETGEEGHGSGPAPTPAPTPAPANKGEGATTKTPEEIAAEAEAKKKAEGSAAQTEEEKAAAAAAAAKQQASNGSGKPLTPEEITQLATKTLLESLGVDSIDQLKEKLAPKVELTPEQQAAKAQQYESNVDNYAVTKGLMTREEIISLANVQKSDAQSLALAEFTKDFKAAKADATVTEIEQAFKLFYNIDSTDEALKAVGQKKIEQVANIIKSELQGKRDKAKVEFDNQLSSKSKVPGFATVVQASIKANVPEEIVLHTDGENKPVFKITPEIRTELEKFLVQQDLFDEYVSAGATQQLSDKLKDRIDGFLFLKNKNAMFKTVYDMGVSVGGKQGSKVGATASFQTKGEGASTLAVDGNENELTPAEMEKLKVLGGAIR